MQRFRICFRKDFQNKNVIDYNAMIYSDNKNAPAIYRQEHFNYLLAISRELMRSPTNWISSTITMIITTAATMYDGRNR